MAGLTPCPSLPPVRQVESVVAYVVRDGRLLVLRPAARPEASVQVPEGRLGEGESIRAAVVRHVAETTGLGTGISGYLGVTEYDMRPHGHDQVQQRHVFQLACGDDRVPETWEHPGPAPARGAEPLWRVLWWHPLDDPDLAKALTSGQGALLDRVRRS